MAGIGNYEFKAVSVKEVFAEGADLLNEHYEEVAHFKDIPLDPNINKYVEVEEHGAFKAFGVYRKDNQKMVGYAGFFVHFNMHYQKSLQAIQDVVFISKSERGFGREFIRWCDQQLKDFGVNVVYHHVKCAHEWGSLLESFGYQRVDHIYAKAL